MSRKLALTATALVAVLAVASQAQAWPFGKKDAAPAAQPAAKADAKTPAAAAPIAPRKATATERQEAAHLEPLARAAFWAREVDVDPQDAEAGVKFSQALRNLSRNDEAAAAADRVLIMHPDNTDAMLELARAHIARGQGFYAIEPAQHAQALAPKDWRPLSLLGVAYEQLGRTEEARAAWTSALALSPDNPAVLTNFAMSYAAAGRADQAEPMLRKAVAQPGATIQTRQDLALVLGLNGKTAEAEQLIRHDLPPELAERNVAWIRTQVAHQTAAAAANPGRTWSAVEASGGTN